MATNINRQTLLPNTKNKKLCHKIKTNYNLFIRDKYKRDTKTSREIKWQRYIEQHKQKYKQQKFQYKMGKTQNQSSI